MGIYEYTRMPFGIKNAPAHFQRMMDTIFQEEILEGWMWCLRQSKRLKAIDPQMNIQMRNHKLLTQLPGELEHAVKCRCNHNCTLDDIANTLQDIRKRTNIGKFTPYKS
ncbi:hypothetical protein O181_096925, partial [Austropuccinia psidii MF-1]|nr:hypothetical protein [Austropuccinia psidii MF-1]